MTKSLLESAATTGEMLELAAVRDNWIRTYKRTTGGTDGELRFEAEKVMLLQLMQSNTALQNCSRPSLYSAWIELAISGLSLRDGLAYIIPYKDKAQFMPGWKGRLEQIAAMPNVVHVEPPQVVYSCDVFEYSLGMQSVIHKHQPVFPRPEGAEIYFAYLVVHFKFGSKAFIMDRDEILNIRNTRSQSYKQYLADLPHVVNGKITKQGRNGTYTKDFEPPMWVTDEAQAFRKTVVKRVYNNMDKLPHHKALDEMIQHRANVDNADEVPDPEEFTGDEYDKLTQVDDDVTYAEVEQVQDDRAQYNDVHENSHPHPHNAGQNVQWANEANPASGPQQAQDAPPQNQPVTQTITDPNEPF